MGTRSFDIRALQQFQHPRWMCENCRGLWYEPPDLELPIRCRICGFSYDGEVAYRVWRHLDENNAVVFDSAVEHARSLGSLASKMQARGPSATPPLHTLFAALTEAQRFVHFITYNISYEFIGVMAMLSWRLDVRGIICRPNAGTMERVASLQAGAQSMEIREIDKGHQKLVVVDGLLAFDGSTNLSLHGWSAAADDLDQVNVVTDVERVTELNNRYFAPLWGQTSRLGDSMWCGQEDGPPFDYDQIPPPEDESEEDRSWADEEAPRIWATPPPS